MNFDVAIFSGDTLHSIKELCRESFAPILYIPRPVFLYMVKLFKIFLLHTSITHMLCSRIFFFFFYSEGWITNISLMLFLLVPINQRGYSSSVTASIFNTYHAAEDSDVIMSVWSFIIGLLKFKCSKHQLQTIGLKKTNRLTNK